MLSQVALQVRAENRLQDAAAEHGIQLSIVDCKAFNKTGMSLLLNLKGEAGALHETTNEIKKTAGVRQVLEGEASGDNLPLLLVLDRPAICRASNDAAIVCLTCPLNSLTKPASWRFIVRRSSDFRQVLSRLGHEGIEARIEEVSPLNQKTSLTGRQKEMVATAVAKGYFEFPRRISLTELSGLVGVRPSTLSEILRSAERRIMQNALGTTFPED